MLLSINIWKCLRIVAVRIHVYIQCVSHKRLREIKIAAQKIRGGNNKLNYNARQRMSVQHVLINAYHSLYARSDIARIKLRLFCNLFRAAVHVYRKYICTKVVASIDHSAVDRATWCACLFDLVV